MGMRRGDGESIPAHGVTSWHTNVTETKQCPAFCVYHPVEACIHPQNRMPCGVYHPVGARIHPHVKKQASPVTNPYAPTWHVPTTTSLYSQTLASSLCMV